jgi:hypothetical protein
MARKSETLRILASRKSRKSHSKSSKKASGKSHSKSSKKASGGGFLSFFRSPSSRQGSSLKLELQKVAGLLAPAVTMVFVRSSRAPGGGEFVDDQWDTACAAVAKKLHLKNVNDAMNHPFIIVGSSALSDPMRYGRRGMPLQHNVTTAAAVALVADAFHRVFGKRYQWSGHANDVLTVRP